MDFGGKADKRHFGWAEKVKSKAIRGRLMEAYYKYVTKDESHKKRCNLPAMQQSHLVGKEEFSGKGMLYYSAIPLPTCSQKDSLP